MGLQDRLAQMVNRGTAYFSDGYSVQLLKRNTLSGSKLVDGGGSPGLNTTDQTSGSATLNLTSLVALSGSLFKGSALSIAGDATVYRTLADVEASGMTLTVTISPALQFPTSQGSAVTASNPPDYTFSALSGNMKEEDLLSLELVRPRKLYLSTQNSQEAPAVNDTIIDGLGADPIQVLAPLAPGTGQVGWSVIIGGKK
jgi:hypothetical protein